jgi:hypothetical protein
MTLEDARNHAKVGAYAAFVSGVLTLGFVLFAISSDAQGGTFGAWNDPLNFVDIVIIVLCGVGMLRNSRTAAVVAFIYFLFAKIFLAIESGQNSGVISGLLFMYFYGRAVYGTFAYHRIRKREDPGYRSAPGWVYWITVPGVLLLVVVFGVTLLSMTGVTPSMEVLAASEVSADDVQALRDAEIIWDGERIEYFYSWGFLSVLEGGTILSDRAVIAYETDVDGVRNVYEIPFDEVRSVERLDDQSDWVTSVYRVTGIGDENWITIVLPDDASGGEEFVNALRSKIPERQSSSFD